MMKQKYIQAELEMISLDGNDVIVTSPTDPNETKRMPVSGASGDHDPFNTI